MDERNKERAFLRKKFKEKGFDTIVGFCKAIESTLAVESWSTYLNRGNDVNTETIMTMGAELGCSPDEMQWILNGRGKYVLASLMKGDEYTLEVKKIARRIAAIENDHRKMKLLNDMLDSMGVGEHG